MQFALPVLCKLCITIVHPLLEYRKPELIDIEKTHCFREKLFKKMCDITSYLPTISFIENMYQYLNYDTMFAWVGTRNNLCMY